jgi:hypothetical protein
MSAPTMSKGKPKKVQDDRSGRKTAPVQIERGLADMLATIATHERTTQAALLTPLIRQWIITNYARVQQEMGQRLKEARDAE